MSQPRPTVVPNRIALRLCAPAGPLDVETAVCLGRELLSTLQVAHTYRREIETCDDSAAWQEHLLLAEQVVGKDPLFRDLAAVSSRVAELLIGRRLVASEMVRLPEVLVRECPDCPRMLAEALFTALASASHVRWQSAEEMARALGGFVPEASDVALAGHACPSSHVGAVGLASTQPPPTNAGLTAPAQAISTTVAAGTTEAAQLADASIAEAVSASRLPPMSSELLRRLVRGASVRKRANPVVPTVSSTSYAISSGKTDKPDKPEDD